MGMTGAEFPPAPAHTPVEVGTPAHTWGPGVGEGDLAAGDSRFCMRGQESDHRAKRGPVCVSPSSCLWPWTW